MRARVHPSVALGLACLAGVACSCARPAETPRDAGTRDADRHAHALPDAARRDDVTAPRAAFVPEGGGPIAFGPRERRFTSEACGACHEAEHRAWSLSAHARAHTDPLYVRELALRPSRACERCHAPLAEVNAAHIEGPWSDEGVGCAACHVRDGVVVHARVSGRAPHETRLDPRVGELEGCRACHQFHFPAPERRGQLVHDEAEWLQDTVGEWMVSAEAARGTTCTDCHFPEVEGRPDHGLSGARDARVLATALDVETRVRARAHVDELTLTLRSRAGHAVPTGDLYRQLEVRAWREGEPASLRSVLLGRRHERRGRELVEVEDDRVFPDAPRLVTLRLPRVHGDDRALHYELRLWSLDPGLAREEQLAPTEVVRRMTRGQLTP